MSSHRKAALAGSAAVLTLVLTACDNGDAGAASGSSTASTSTPATTASTGMSQSAGTTDGAGTMFAAMMVAHHQDGIKLAQMAVSKASNVGVKEVAQRALKSQQQELPQLQTIARSGGMSAMPPEDPIQKFTQQQMARLQTLSGTQFDRTWLDTFSSHHMSAIMMSDTAMPASSGDAKALQQKIHDEQLKDVSDMNTLRAKLGN